MSEKLTKLLSISSAAIAIPPNARAINALADSNPSPLLNELCALLADKNGFFSFESALLIRPLDYLHQPLGILQWNDTNLWKKHYKIDLDNSVFFGEDIFGMQFCIKDNAVQSFDPETGRFKKIGNTLDVWTQWVLEKHQLRTGWPLAHQWQVQHGALQPGMRLLPKVPFVCDGQFAVENLYQISDAEGMRFRASIANQLIGIPDGGKIVIKIDKQND
jgi:hypothetical protein